MRPFSRDLPLSATSFDKNRIKILLLEGVHESAVETLTAAGYQNLTRLDHALQGEELATALSSAHMLGIRSRTQLTAEVIARAPRLMAVGCFCIGTNQVSLDAATRAGVPVFNAPYSNTRSVAELVLAEAILLLRFHDAVKKLNLGNARQVDHLEELLKNADVVSAHVPATAATVNLLTRERLAVMKPEAVLINASRGNVVDLEALAEMLRGAKLLGAAIDVFPEEPKSNNEPFVSPLKGLNNVILTPHVGGSTMEAQENIGFEVAEKLIRYSDNGSTLSAVNFPEVALPEHAGQHRLLHIHENITGVLTAINQVLSDSNVNIAGQYLQTQGDIGYVVIDVTADYSAEVLDALKTVNGTIRTRVLF
jgi:D-3-phosphoglycerate dehydrogenase